MGDYGFLCVPGIQRGLGEEHLFPRNPGPHHPPEKLFGLAGEHAAANNFKAPNHIANDNKKVMVAQAEGTRIIKHAVMAVVRSDIVHRARQSLLLFCSYVMLATVAVVMLLPFFWMISTSLKDLVEALRIPSIWIPKPIRFENFPGAWNAAPFGRYFFNSFFIAFLTTIGEVICASLAAYAFAKMNFFGKNVLFMLLLGTLMIPGQMLLVPNFITIKRLGWYNTYWALIIPWIASVFSIFLLRQFFRTISDELWDSARIDGCSRFRYLWRIVAPLSQPALATVALFNFVGSWNAFLLGG